MGQLSASTTFFMQSIWIGGDAAAQIAIVLNKYDSYASMSVPVRVSLCEASMPGGCTLFNEAQAERSLN